MKSRVTAIGLYHTDNDTFVTVLRASQPSGHITNRGRHVPAESVDRVVRAVDEARRDKRSAVVPHRSGWVFVRW
jgi:hypothetical protein